ncbi:MAG TPA: phosphatase PAP2 family protein [Candidatus Elarobacter sp.]
MILRLLSTAVVLLLLTIVLGAFVAQRPPGSLDVAALALRGHGVAIADLFTALGRWWMLLPIGVVTFGIAMVLRANLVPLVVVFAAQAASQGVNALLKLGFQRERQLASIGAPERDLSYPSGHSVTAVVFFAALAILAWHAPVPRPLALTAAAILAICVAGIPWSRLALGAHYATDVIGGLAFGGAWLAITLAVLIRLSVTATR